jgi:hypothetical protein
VSAPAARPRPAGEPIPFATDDELGKRIREVESELRRRAADPSLLDEDAQLRRRADTELADELNAIAHLLVPDWARS